MACVSKFTANRLSDSSWFLALFCELSTSPHWLTKADYSMRRDHSIVQEPREVFSQMSLKSLIYGLNASVSRPQDGHPKRLNACG